MLVIASKFQMLDFLSNNLYQDMIYIERIWKWRMIPDFPTGINEFLIIAGYRITITKCFSLGNDVQQDNTFMHHGIQCTMWDFTSNFPVSKNLSNWIGMKLEKLLSISMKIQYFKTNFWFDGRKMQKNFTFKSFLYTFKETFCVETFEEGLRRNKL